MTTSTGYRCPQCGSDCYPTGDHIVVLITCGNTKCPTKQTDALGVGNTIRAAFESFAADCEENGLTAWADAAARDALHRGALS